MTRVASLYLPMLPIERLGQTVTAHPDFLLVVSYNPGYQATAKDLKPSTRQRFLAIEFDYPSPEHEAEIIAHESGADAGVAHPGFQALLGLLSDGVCWVKLSGAYRVSTAYPDYPDARPFHEALVNRGFLGLGMKESLRFTAQADAFREFALAEKIYQRI